VQKIFWINFNTELQSNVRGSRQYFHALVGKVKPMILELFIKTSCAEWCSPEFIKHLSDINSHVVGVDKMTPAELTAMVPLSVVIHLYKKWRAVFNDLFCVKLNPVFGKIKNNY